MGKLYAVGGNECPLKKTSEKTKSLTTGQNITGMKNLK